MWRDESPAFSPGKAAWMCMPPQAVCSASASESGKRQLAAHALTEPLDWSSRTSRTARARRTSTRGKHPREVVGPPRQANCSSLVQTLYLAPIYFGYTTASVPAMFASKAPPASEADTPRTWNAPRRSGHSHSARRLRQQNRRPSASRPQGRF